MLEYFRMVTKKSKKNEDSDTDDEDVLFPTRNTSKGCPAYHNMIIFFFPLILLLETFITLIEKVQNSKLFRRKPKKH